MDGDEDEENNISSNIDYKYDVVILRKNEDK